MEREGVGPSDAEYTVKESTVARNNRAGQSSGSPRVGFES